MKTDDFREVRYEKDEQTGIVMLTINIPKRKNALSKYTFYELFEAVDAMEKDDSAHAMVLTGGVDPDLDNPKKEAFSSGGYFHPTALEGVSEEIIKQFDFSDIAQKKLTIKMYNCNKPIISAINGCAIGAGFTLPLSGTDLIYMSEHAWIQLPFNSLSIISELASSFLLSRLMGFQKAKEILYFSKKITAEEAVALGIANEVIPHDQLITYAKEKASQLIPPKAPGMAIRVMKQTIHRPFIEAVSQSLDLENEGLNKLFKSADFAEAIASRKEKRVPVFQGA